MMMTDSCVLVSCLEFSMFSVAVITLLYSLYLCIYVFDFVS